MTDAGDLKALAERLRRNTWGKDAPTNTSVLGLMVQAADALDRLAATPSAELDQKKLQPESGHQTEQAAHVLSLASYQRELFDEINKAVGVHGLSGVLEHLRKWTAYIDGDHRKRYADLIEAQAKLIASYVNAAPANTVTDRVLSDRSALEDALPIILGLARNITASAVVCPHRAVFESAVDWVEKFAAQTQEQVVQRILNAPDGCDALAGPDVLGDPASITVPLLVDGCRSEKRPCAYQKKEPRSICDRCVTAFHRDWAST